MGRKKNKVQPTNEELRAFQDSGGNVNDPVVRSYLDRGGDMDTGLAAVGRSSQPSWYEGEMSDREALVNGW